MRHDVSHAIHPRAREAHPGHRHPIAGKLEKLMADNIDAGLIVEHAVGVSWLKGER